MTDYRAAITAELQRLEEDMLYSEKAHFVAAEELKRVHLWVGLVATVTAAAAAATIVADKSPVLSGSLALVATLASALVTFVKPEARAAQHLAAARNLGAIRVQARQHREVDLHPEQPVNPDKLRDYVTAIAEAKRDADAAAPSISDRRFEKARKKIQAGHFTHDAGKQPTEIASENSGSSQKKS
jgi:hypothetical protein